MPRQPDPNAEFTRHVRRMQRQELLRTVGPFALAGAILLGLLGFMAWNTFTAVPCGEVTGVVQGARSETTFAGERHFLTVKGDDQNNYFSEDPGDRADPEGARVVLGKSCSHTGGARPMAHFERWADADRG